MLFRSIKEAKTIISDKVSDTDAELTDYERIDLLKRIKTQMLNVREVMSVAYTGIFNCDKNIEIDRTVFEAAFGL